MISRNCPICGGSAGKSIIKSKKNAENLPFVELSKNFVGLRADQTFFEYKRCAKCNLCFAPRYFSADELELVYRNMPPNLVGDEQKIVEKTHEGYVKHIKKNLSSANSLIELGADLGLVTGPVVKHFKINYGILIEPNIDVRDELINSVENKNGFEVVNYLSESKSGQKFDLFVGVHVIDHLLEPLKDLTSIQNKMTSGGKLFIVVHNQKSLLAKIMRSKWPPYCLQHPQIFDKKSINNLLINSGFTNISINRTVNWIGLRNSLTSLLSLLKIPNRFLKFLPNISVPIIFGNIIISAEVK
jgi:phospholipid N-methyltransferase